MWPTIHDSFGLVTQSFFYIPSILFLFAIFIRIIRVNKNFHIPFIVLFISLIPTFITIQEYYGDISGNGDFLYEIIETSFWSSHLLWFLVVYELVYLSIKERK